MELVKNANLAVRFLLELCALAALGSWGYRSSDAGPTKVLLAVVVPLAMAIIWGLFLSPNATAPLPGGMAVLLQLTILGIAAVALFRTGHEALAIAFGLVVVANAALLRLWHQ